MTRSINVYSPEFVNEFDKETLFVGRKDQVSRIVPELRQKEARARTATESNLQKKWV